METLPTLAECEKATTNHEYMIGSGRDRIGFHIPGSRWVYKVAKCPSDEVNQAEYKRYQRISCAKLPDGVALPQMHLLENGVIASEYIDGEKPVRCTWQEHESHTKPGDCWRATLDAFEDAHNVYDSSALCNLRQVTDDQGNVTIYIIDLGE